MMIPVCRVPQQPDVDVSLEGHAGKVSRQQAKLELKRDGCFYVRNYGARPMYVNSTKLDKVRWDSSIQHISPL